MTILIHDYLQLEERAARHLRVWKGWHITLFVFAAVFGILNYVFLQNTMQLVDNNCVLYPRKLEFHMVELPEPTDKANETINSPRDNGGIINKNDTTSTIVTTDSNVNENVTETPKSKREAETHRNDSMNEETTVVVVNNITVVTANKTHHLMLDTSRSLFGRESDCQFAEYMPILCTVFAAVWTTFFTMCPGGGHPRSGLRQPWRILTPALLFAIVLVGLTGHSFNITNGGILAFCSAFYNFTNTTTCSAANVYIELGQNASWGMGGRAAAARAASAGAWASWACAAALLFARCLAAPDFHVKRTGVYLLKDPQNKLAPHLKKSVRYNQKSAQGSPSMRDNMSVKSEPTAITELVTATVEPGQDSAPTSVTVTPIKNQRHDIDMIDLTPEENCSHR